MVVLTSECPRSSCTVQPSNARQPASSFPQGDRRLRRPANVGAVFEQMRGEGVAQDVRGDGLGDSGLAGGPAHGSLDVDLVQVMASGASGARVDREPGGGEHVLPSPTRDAVGQFHIAVTLGQIRLVNGAHFGDLLPQFLDKRNGQGGDAVLAAVDGSAAGGSTLRARLRRVCLTASQAVRLPRRTVICMSSRSMSWILKRSPSMSRSPAP